jgi:hypothetical protein
MNQAQPFASWWCVELGTGQRKSVGSGTEPESRVGLGCLQELVETGRCPGWSAGGQAQVRENLGKHGGLFDGRDEGQGAAALRTGSDVF